jgi:hypothetical protein
MKKQNTKHGVRSRLPDGSTNPEYSRLKWAARSKRIKAGDAPAKRVYPKREETGEDYADRIMRDLEWFNERELD